MSKGKKANSPKPSSKPAKKNVKARKTQKPVTNTKASVAKPKSGAKPPAPKKPAPAKGKPAPAKAAKEPAPKAGTSARGAKPAPKPAPAPKPVKAAAPATTATPAKPLPQKQAPAAVAQTASVPAPAPRPAPAAAIAPKPTKPAKAGGKKGVEVISEPAPVLPPVEKRPTPTGPGSTVTKGGAIFYDSHMHTPLCKHAWGEPEEYAEQGLKAGLKGIIFTCHCPMPGGFWPTVRMAENEFDTYVDIVARARERYKGKIDVWLGLESEYFPGMERYIEELHEKADFHFILGSVHWQAKEYLAKFETGTIENFRRTYFDQLAISAETGLYDCLAHPDLVKNYNPDSWCFAIVKNHVAKSLDRIAATGVAMEVNTSGLNKSYSEMNPGNELLAMMAQRGIPIVIGSDAHRAVRVGDNFLKALENVKAAGYKEISYFEWRKRKTLKVDEVVANLKKHATV